MVMKKLRERFMKIYPNIPLGARNEIVAVVEGNNLTYHGIWSLIVEETLIDQALEKMDKMGIL